MTDGWWRIKQHAPNTRLGFTVTDEPISVPDQWQVADHALVIWSLHGTETHYPWASIVHAEYQPPTSDKP